MCIDMEANQIESWMGTLAYTIAYPLILTSVFVFVYFLISGNLGRRYR